jgi:hypothetical protein
VSSGRDWMLVAPWYRWRRQGVPARDTRPVLQKYEVSDPVAVFREDPQRSLKFTTDDLVHRIDKAPALPGLPAPMAGLQRRLSPVVRVPTDLRKLYLDTHKRWYLVVAELRIDDPGFPCVPRREACEAGFVIRKRKLDFPIETEPEVRGILRDLGAATVELGQARRRADGLRVAIVREGATVGDDRVREAITLREEAVDVGRRRLADWASRVGARRVELGWVPDPRSERIGAWQSVDAEPQRLTEATTRMYPLVQDPPDPSATLYFGLVPTGSSDATDAGDARFDDDTSYEIRCYVRRHDPGCPKTSRPGDCQGELFWSRPTEAYRLAPHFDLTGTSNRPVTIQLPDLKALEAEAVVGKAGLRLKAPSESSLEFEIDGDNKPVNGSRQAFAQICSFAIPLITIVATFVFKLFLPILVLLFNLWFLLKLRFCIPPSVELDADIDAAVAAIGDVELDVELDVDLQADLKVEFDGIVGKGSGTKLAATYSNRALLDLRADLGTDLSKPSFAPSLTAGVEYEEPEIRAEVALA